MITQDIIYKEFDRYIDENKSKISHTDIIRIYDAFRAGITTAIKLVGKENGSN